MPHVRIVNTSGHGAGTSIEIDGVPFTRVRDIQFHAGMNGPVTVTFEVIPSSIEIDAFAVVTHVTPHRANTADPDGYGHAV